MIQDSGCCVSARVEDILYMNLFEVQGNQQTYGHHLDLSYFVLGSGLKPVHNWVFGGQTDHRDGPN